MDQPPVCRRCRRPVVIEQDNFEVFEQMHYVCFHYEFEHDPTDPDEECGAGGCPSAWIRPRPDPRPQTGGRGQRRERTEAHRGSRLAVLASRLLDTNQPSSADVAAVLAELLALPESDEREELVEALDVFQPTDTPDPGLIGFGELRSQLRDVLHDLGDHSRCVHEIDVRDRPEWGTG